MITIIQVMREMKVEPEPRLTWSVGARVRDKFQMLHGHLPLKELREKTNDGGTHCFAVYPESMRDVIKLEILAHQAEAAKQGELDLNDNQQEGLPWQ